MKKIQNLGGPQKSMRSIGPPILGPISSTPFGGVRRRQGGFEPPFDPQNGVKSGRFGGGFDPEIVEIDHPDLTIATSRNRQILGRSEKCTFPEKREKRVFWEKQHFRGLKGLQMKAQDLSP